ncbi:MAG: alpha/beta hydrolase [Myxococcota bacterium]
MDVALFAVGVVAMVGLVLVVRPPRRPGELAALFFMWSWLAGELPLHHALVLLAPSAAFVAAGALATPLGAVGLGLVALGLIGPVLAWRAVARVRARAEALLGEPVRADVGFWRYALPLWFGDRAIARSVVKERGVVADVYRPREVAKGLAPRGDRSPAPRPILVYVHGGAWVLGFRRWQGRPLMRRLVRAGWMAVSIEYRRAPLTPWPGPIDDVRLALDWVRATLPGQGGDASKIVLSGNSAGGHLAALAALTDRGAPPVAACVPWYGVYDLVDDAGLWPHGALRRLWSWVVMRASLAAARERWVEASPVTHLAAAGPRFLVIHGTHDTLVPVAVARDFERRLGALAPDEIGGAPRRPTSRSTERSTPSTSSPRAAARWRSRSRRAGSSATSRRAPSRRRSPRRARAHGPGTLSSRSDSSTSTTSSLSARRPARMTRPPASADPDGSSSSAVSFSTEIAASRVAPAQLPPQHRMASTSRCAPRICAFSSAKSRSIVLRPRSRDSSRSRSASSCRPTTFSASTSTPRRWMRSCGSANARSASATQAFSAW